MPSAILIFVAVAGVFSIFVGFLLRRRDPEFKSATWFSDLLLRVAFVCFGIMFAVVSFFSQKWTEEINTKIDQANESISNINVIQAKFASQTESLYYNNECIFRDLTRACKKIAAKDDRSSTYCEKPTADGDGLTVQNVLDGIDYFDVDAPAEFYPDFFGDLDKQVFVKQSFAADTFKDMFDLYASMVEKSNIVRNYAKSFSAKHDKIQETFAKLAPDLNLSHGASSEALIYAHDMCCTVKNISDFSDDLAKLASKQMNQFCSVRTRIGEALESQIAPYYRLFVESRLEAIRGRIEYGNRICAFAPRPAEECP